MTLTPHQQQAAALVTSHPISILGGSPGTGKTFVASSIIAAAIDKIGRDKIAVCAPTGKAAVRITEALADNGVGLRATTIHSLLRVQQNSVTDGWGFEHGADNPLPFSLIVCDESSMVDASLMAAFLSARRRNCSILFVGDVNQLPPVGAGAPLRDMIRAGVPYAELREIVRNDGGIVDACARIRDGQDFEPGGNLLNLADLQLSIDHAFARAISDDLDIIRDVQILCATNKVRKELNSHLQNQLNKSQAVRGTPFRVGDKAINTKNGWYPTHGNSQGMDVVTNEHGEVYVANGEIGYVLESYANRTIVELSSPDRTILVPRGVQKSDDDGGQGGSGSNWELAYAISVHKSQGSEFPIAVVVIEDSGGARMVCSREWIYTAISRAKKLCVIAGSIAVANAMARRQAIGVRKTFLSELIQERQVTHGKEKGGNEKGGVGEEGRQAASAVH